MTHWIHWKDLPDSAVEGYRRDSSFPLFVRVVRMTLRCVLWLHLRLSKLTQADSCLDGHHYSCRAKETADSFGFAQDRLFDCARLCRAQLKMTELLTPTLDAESASRMGHPVLLSPRETEDSFGCARDRLFGCSTASSSAQDDNISWEPQISASAYTYTVLL